MGGEERELEQSVGSAEGVAEASPGLDKQPVGDFSVITMRLT